MNPPAPYRKLQNNFFVDTKTTCFLCMQEISPVIRPIPVIDLEEDFKDKIGDSLITPVEPVTGQDDKTEKFCLRAIYKYLKVSPGKVLSKKFNGTESPNSQLSSLLNIDLSVLLCGSCTKITTSLSKLCQELEVLQMKVDHSLDMFLKVLQISDKHPERMKSFKSQLKNPLEMLQASIAEYIRKETQEKCGKKLNSFMPKVKMVNLEKVFNTPTSVKQPQTDVAAIDKQIPPSLPPLLGEETLKKIVIPAKYKCNLCGCGFGSLSGVLKHKRKSHPNSGISSVPTTAGHQQLASNGFTCNLCGLILRSKQDYIQHKRLSCNSATSTRLTTIPPLRIQPLPSPSTLNPSPPLNVQTVMGSKLMKPANYKCSQCGLAYESLSGLRRHERRRHPTSSTSTPGFSRVPVKTATIPLKCTTCGLKLPSKADWIRHTRLYCHQRRAIKIEAHEIPTLPVTIGTDATTTSSSVNIIMPTTEDLTKLMNPMPQIQASNGHLMCSLCPANSGDTFSKDNLLRRHLFCFHPDYFFTPVKLPEHSIEQFKDLCRKLVQNELESSSQGNLNGNHIVTYSCVHCSHVCYEKRAMNTHLIQGHYQLLASKLVDLQRKYPPSATPTNSKSVPSLPQGAETKLSGNPVSETPRQLFNCRDCGKIFTDSSNLRRHRKRFCIYRHRTKQDNPNAVDYAVEARRKPYTMPSTAQFKCQDCDAVFSHSPSLSRHRKNVHFVVSTPKPKPLNPKPVDTAVNSQEKFNCPDCGASFPYYKSLWRHRQTFGHYTGYTRKEQNGPASYFCDACGKGFKEKRYLRRHKVSTCIRTKGNELVHSGNVTSSYNNILTSAGLFVSPNFYAVAVPSVSSQPELAGASNSKQLPHRQPTSLVNCDICGKVFTSTSVMRRHQRENCPLREKAIPQQTSLSTEANNQDYYNEGDEDDYAASYVDTKFEVLDMPQVQLSNTKEHGGVMGIQEDNLYFGAMQSLQNQEYVGIGDNIKVEDDTGMDDGMMILPTIEDPLM